MTVTAAAALGAILSQDRVAAARQAKESGLRRDLKAIGLAYPALRLYLRGLKRERQLEVWVAARTGRFKRFRTYAVQALSGDLGPKRQGGDRQVPEGFYTVDRFNPRSNFLLSLGLDYPNVRDLAHATGPPGGDIFIHGNRVSIGCLAMGDEAIQEIYLLAAGARRPIRVDIFPTRMTDENWGWLRKQGDSRMVRFWASLRRGYLAFERTRKVPRVAVTKHGYIVRQ